ncbi:NADPH-dependent 7-cyano-7-deazaguanine reductase QueF [Luminiphilus sp.]|nr:NADPH-dependent 7-cyano-7-deazaguanine reductase QueF [Luminiphilus sp.]
MDAVLGKKVAAPQYYAPEVLEPIDRSLGRRGITGPSLHVDQGHDVWHCYELSWLLPDGQVRYATGVLVVPASSPFTVESKSLKLYLNSLNAHVFENDNAAIRCICNDLAAVTGSPVMLEIMSSVDLRSASWLLDDIAHLGLSDGSTTRFACSGFRSLCPVTAQPDWASLIIDVSSTHFNAGLIGESVDALRNHQGFHEQCIEDLFTRLERALTPDELHVVGFFQRRGGIDITPWRSSQACKPRFERLFEQ